MSKPKKPLPAPERCPFCGGKPRNDNSGPRWDEPYAIYCRSTKCRVNPIVFGRTVHIALQRWNKRAKI